jgi:hypothetical protein
MVVELRASCLLGRHSTTWASLPAYCMLVTLFCVHTYLICFVGELCFTITRCHNILHMGLLRGKAWNLFIYLLLLLYWGYIVTFTKVHIIYHSWIHLLHHPPLSLLPPFLEWFNRAHFSIYIHVIFTPHSPSNTCSLYPPTGINLLHRTCFALLFSVFEIKWYFCLR